HVELEALRKVLQRLEQQPAEFNGEQLRKEIRKALEQIPKRAALQGVQRPDDVLVWKGFAGAGKPDKYREAALDALRKALERLEKHPGEGELERARQQLRKAIERLEKGGAMPGMQWKGFPGG